MASVCTKRGQNFNIRNVPPGVNRHAIDFYYPNPINDFWRIMGLIFYGDKMALFDDKSGVFDITRIKDFLTERGIALNDTVRRARRLKGNASDKFLEVVEAVPPARSPFGNAGLSYDCHYR